MHIAITPTTPNTIVMFLDNVVLISLLSLNLISFIIIVKSTINNIVAIIKFPFILGFNPLATFNAVLIEKISETDIAFPLKTLTK